MAAATRATLIGRDDAHFRDLLARLPDGERATVDRHVATVASSFDAVVHPIDAATLAGTFEVRIERPGHYGLLFSRRVFEIVAENLDHRADPSS